MEKTKTEYEQTRQQLLDFAAENLNMRYKIGHLLMKDRNQKFFKLKDGRAFRTFEKYCQGFGFDYKEALAYIATAEALDHIISVVTSNLSIDEVLQYTVTDGEAFESIVGIAILYIQQTNYHAQNQIESKPTKRGKRDRN